MAMGREELEEFAMAMRDVARTVKAQYDAYLEVGFTSAQALQLCGDHVRVLMQPGDDGN